MREGKQIRGEWRKQGGVQRIRGMEGSGTKRKKQRGKIKKKQKRKKKRGKQRGKRQKKWGKK